MHQDEFTTIESPPLSFDKRSAPKSEWQPVMAWNILRGGMYELERTDFRIFLDLVGEDFSRTFTTPEGNELLNIIPTDTAVLYYSLSEKSLIGLVLYKKVIHPFDIKVSLDELTDIVESATIWLKSPCESTATTPMSSSNDPLSKLSFHVLEPVYKNIMNCKRLVIIADSPLQAFPFECLPFPLNGASYPLGLQLPVTYWPSLTWILRTRNMVKQSPKGEARVTVFGCPYFSEHETETAKSLGRLFDRTVGSLNDLPGVLAEVEAIQALYEKENMNVVAKIGHDATKLAMRTLSKEADLIHIATHGISDLAFPEMSALALAQESDTSLNNYSTPINVDWLHANEIARLNFNPQFVMLSACQTAIGPVHWGEGVLGLPRAFLLCGTRAVVASLWNIEDKSTALFAEKVHCELLKGQSIDKAMFEARKFIATKFPHPFYWAAFILIGHNQPIFNKRLTSKERGTEKK